MVVSPEAAKSSIRDRSERYRPAHSCDPLRRRALLELSAFSHVALIRWPVRLADPLAGTIVEYQAGRARRDWTAAE